MVDPRFTPKPTRFRGWVFSLRTASCLLAMAGLGTAMNMGSDVPGQGGPDEEPAKSEATDSPVVISSWFDWTGVPMEPIFAVELFLDRRKAETAATSPAAQQKLGQADEKPTEQEVLTEPVATEAPPDQKTELDAGELADAGTTAASAPKTPKSPWDELDLSLFRRAITPVPAGIPVARATERRASSDAAIAEFGAALGGSNGELWLSYLGDALRYGQSEPQEWAGAANLVARLELFELAPAVVTGLELGPDTFVYQAAWSTLAQLYGQRFDNVAQWQAFVGDAGYNPLAKRAIAELRERSRLARSQQLELFAYHLDQAAEHLSDFDPLVRLGAAEVLGAALREGTIERDTTLDQLLARLQIESQPIVLESMLDALFTVLENRPAGDPHVEQLRQTLAESALSQAPSAELLVARALARLQWAGAEAVAVDSLETGVGLIAAILRRAGGAATLDSPVDPANPVPVEGVREASKFEQDADVLLGVLKALDKLCRGVGGDSVTAARLAASVDQSPLLKLVLSEDVDLGVREVAAGTLPRVAPPEDVAVLIEVLCSGEQGISSELRYALMGAMKRFVERDDASPAQIAPVISCLLDHMGRTEEHMRERALTALLSDALTKQITSSHALLFIERLAVEAAPSLQDKLLLLIERNGDSSMLNGILGLPNFDSLVARGAAAEKSMLDLVTKLAGNDPNARYSAAKRIYPRVDQVIKRIPLGVRALALIAELPPEAVADFTVVQHRDIVKWSFELRVYGVVLAKRLPNGVDFLQRLVDLHVPKSGGGEAYSAPEKALMQALFLSDIAEAKGNGEAAALRLVILAKFGDAEERAADHTAANFDKVIRRARARFFCTSGDFGPAFKDFMFVFESADAHLLEPADLRSAVQSSLAQANLREAAAAAAAGDLSHRGDLVPSEADFLAAYNFGLALVKHASWNKEPAPVRYDDLRGLAIHAFASQNLGAMEQVAALLESLPSKVPIEGQPANAEVGDSRAWHGLESDPERLAELNKLRETIASQRSRLEALKAAENPVEVATDPVPDPVPVTEPPVDTPGKSGEGAAKPVGEVPEAGDNR